MKGQKEQIANGYVTYVTYVTYVSVSNGIPSGNLT